MQKDWTVKQVQSAPPGRHRVSDSLYLIVAPNGGKRWAFRYTSPRTKRVTEHGLGSIDVTTLSEARTKVHELRRMVAKGADPVDTRGGTSAIVTFASVAADYLAVKSRTYRNANSAKNEQLLLLTHASALGPQPIAGIGVAHVNAALRPVWLVAPQQAKRATAAVLRVLRYARASGHGVANVGDMREDMAHLMPRTNGKKRNFTALDYKAVPDFMRRLREAQQHGDALSPAVIEFIVLTAARENEVCGMQWSEIDWQECVWTLPAARSKTNTEHRTPLCNRALTLLAGQRGPSVTGEPADPHGYVWPGRAGDGPVTGKSVYKYLVETMGVKASIHGFRSSFRDWAGDMTHFARNDIEECLGHAVGNAVERSYRRKDGLEKRRVIMAAWEAYSGGHEGQD
jgi:integrase